MLYNNKIIIIRLKTILCVSFDCLTVNLGKIIITCLASVMVNEYLAK